MEMGHVPHLLHLFPSRGTMSTTSREEKSAGEKISLRFPPFRRLGRELTDFCCRHGKDSQKAPGREAPSKIGKRRGEEKNPQLKGLEAAFLQSKQKGLGAQMNQNSGTVVFTGMSTFTIVI
ncbi:hypothetical protein MLD38_031601 [Melastoma candidum]|uniref:Uncharacterized protein n=1 Tax=Melastoma candidum TaxID=119954 RepID=A0ACB9MQ01_9MYRT|nr:hypothetical protein MLD38_031601 [Melastoma candidum]